MWEGVGFFFLLGVFTEKYLVFLYMFLYSFSDAIFFLSGKKNSVKLMNRTMLITSDILVLVL